MRFPIKLSDNLVLELLVRASGVTAETSFADLSDGVLEVQMGRWFQEKIDVTKIAKIAPSDWPWWGGLGVKLGHHGVGVVGDYKNIVNIQFKEPLKVHVLVVVEVTQLWLSVEDQDGFLKALSAATGLEVSPHTPF